MDDDRVTRSGAPRSPVATHLELRGADESRWAHYGCRSLTGTSRAALVAAALLALLLAFAPPAHADDLSDFLLARDAFVNNDFDIALSRFRDLLQHDPPLLRTGLIPPAREYVVASLILLNRIPDATRELERLLRDDPDVQFDTLLFSPAVISLVQDTRARMEPELAAVRTRRRETASQEAARRARQRELLQQIATQERLVIHTPRWMMFVPLGVGQFANDDAGFGAGFLALDLLSAGTAITTYFVQYALFPPTRLYNDSLYLGLRDANIIAWTVFGVAMVGGVVHANLTYRPERTRIRNRPPPDWLNTIQIGFAPRLDGHGGDVQFGLRF